MKVLFVYDELADRYEFVGVFSSQETLDAFVNVNTMRTLTNAYGEQYRSKRLWHIEESDVDRATTEDLP